MARDESQKVNSESQEFNSESLGEVVKDAAGRVKENVEETTDKAKKAEELNTSTENAAESARGKTEETTGKVGEKTQGFKEVANDAGSEAKENALETANNTGEKARVTDTAQDSAGEAKSKADDTSVGAKKSAEETANKAGPIAEEVRDRAQDSAGQTKSEAQDEVQKAQDSAKEAAHETGYQAGEVGDRARDSAGQAKSKAQDKADKAQDSANEAANEAGEKLGELGDRARDFSGQATSKAQDKADKAQESAKAAGNETEEKAGEVRDRSQDSAEHVPSEAANTAGDLKNSVKENVNETAEQTGKFSISNSAKEGKIKAEDKVGQLRESSRDSVGEVKSKTEESVGSASDEAERAEEKSNDKSGFRVAGEDMNVHVPPAGKEPDYPEEYGAADDEFVTRTSYAPETGEETERFSTSDSALSAEKTEDKSGFGVAGQDMNVHVPPAGKEPNYPEEYGAADDEFLTRTKYAPETGEQAEPFSTSESALSSEKTEDKSGFGVAGEDINVHVPAAGKEPNYPEEYGAADDEFVTRTSYAPETGEQTEHFGTSDSALSAEKTEDKSEFGVAGKDMNVHVAPAGKEQDYPEEYGAADDEFVTRTNYAPETAEQTEHFSTSDSAKQAKSKDEDEARQFRESSTGGSVEQVKTEKTVGSARDEVERAAEKTEDKSGFGVAGEDMHVHVSPAGKESDYTDEYGAADDEFVTRTSHAPELKPNVLRCRTSDHLKNKIAGADG